MWVYLVWRILLEMPLLKKCRSIELCHGNPRTSAAITIEMLSTVRLGYDCPLARSFLPLTMTLQNGK